VRAPGVDPYAADPFAADPYAADARAEDAIRTDTYVEWLLDGAEAGRPAEPDVVGADPSVALAARALRDALGRSHPSFRFEERLSRRLAELAIAMRRAAAVGGSPGAATVGATIADTGAGWAAAFSAVRDRRPAGELVAFPRPAAAGQDGPTAASADGPTAAASRVGVRPVLAGGAVASAALSIGAAALVAWRRTHVRRGVI